MDGEPLYLPRFVSEADVVPPIAIDQLADLIVSLHERLDIPQDNEHCTATTEIARHLTEALRVGMRVGANEVSAQVVEAGGPLIRFTVPSDPELENFQPEL